MRITLRRASIAVGSAALLGLGLSAPAQASQPIGATYSPETNDSGQTIEAWAEMTGDCPTVRCDTYLKIQRQVHAGVGGVGERWEDVTGAWISRQAGWVSVSAGLNEGDCGVYRTVIEDWQLTDLPDGSVNLLIFEFGLDGGQEYQPQTYVSAPSAPICGNRVLDPGITY